MYEGLGAGQGPAPRLSEKSKDFSDSLQKCRYFPAANTRADSSEQRFFDKLRAGRRPAPAFFPSVF